jgi:hypothetical protein
MIITAEGPKKQRWPRAADEILGTHRVFEQIHDGWGQADTLRGLGTLYARVGPVPIARDYLERARDGYERLGATSLTEELEIEIARLDREAPDKMRS